MPKPDENFANKYKLINQIPVLFINKSSNSDFTANLSKRFINLYPYDCPINTYKIYSIMRLD